MIFMIFYPLRSKSLYTTRMFKIPTTQLERTDQFVLKFSSADSRRRVYFTKIIYLSEHVT